MLAQKEGLDAWQSYHRGLHYMLRFTSEGLGHAREFFQRAIDLNAAFARAHAGVSYCHFLEAFLKPRDARRPEIELALRSASIAIELDELSPTSRWAYGRALWLSGDEDGGLAQLSMAIDLSPSFAMGFQTLAFMLSQSGNPVEAISHAQRAEALSPHDPFLCAMQGSHAMALLRLGRVEEAARMGLLAARQHNVHKHILGIAAIALAAAGREDEARDQVARIRRLDVDYDLTRFNGAFMQLSEDFTTVARKAAIRIGLA
jgi:tetratricopeptide (TPR) repeat protein